MKIIDIHSHLLPHVDDGVKTEEEAEQILVKYRDAGISMIVCTPHISNPYVQTKILNIRDSYVWLKDLALQYGIDVVLGSELFIKPEQSKFIPFLEKFLLIETPMRVEPLYLLDRIFELQLKGFTIILAHVERYSWMQPDSETAIRMQEMGVHFQVNIQGIENGSAQPYLDADQVSFIATDNHGTGRRDPINLSVFHDYPEIITRANEILNL